MFNCPTELQVVRKRHFLGAVTNSHRITTSDFILCVLGGAIGVAVILICLMMPLVSKYRAVRKVEEDLIAMQEEED